MAEYNEIRGEIVDIEDIAATALRTAEAIEATNATATEDNDNRPLDIYARVV
ncbi:hypothetical protein VM1G_11707 [Cytospora mali]|uniref:Uncharacterized protein n=1 Tax=Cytospora mali TaxID=578113 RepID=A0A194W1J9_CYTMA|nr:hypothetical protein VM1G_11707 [Valsa mali]